MIVWCILYESLAWTILGTGFFLGVVTAVFANAFLVSHQPAGAYRFNIPMLLAYLFVLLYRIFKAGFSVIPAIITGKTKTGIIDITTKVPEGLASTTLANSITLTPGTVTIEKSGQNLKVLWLQKTTDDPVEAAKIIVGPIEKILIKAAKHD